MPWIKRIYSGKPLGEDFLDHVLADIVAYAADAAVHGADAWTIVRNRSWPYGTVLKVPNRLDDEYGYMALMTDRPRVGSSYWNWLKQPDILRKTFVMNKNGLGLGDGSDFTISGGVVTTYARTGHAVAVKWTENSSGARVPTKYSTNYSFTTANNYRFRPQPEIFTKNANVLFFSMFKQYQEDFDWSDLMGNERRTIKIKPLCHYGIGQVSPSFFDPPLYPGVGCPAIGFSPEFLKTADEAAVYIRKERHHMDLAIHIVDRWETASVGFFEPFDTKAEYSFPAMAIGGTSGVLPLAELKSYTGGPPHVETGFRLDYTETNWTMAHGIASFASTWWDGTNIYLDNFLYSQAQAMLPDGNWQSFADFGLQRDVYYNYTWGMFYEANKEPDRIPKSRYFITPSYTDLSGVTNIYPTGAPHTVFYDDKLDIRNRQAYQLEPLYFIQRTEDNINQNMLGRVQDLYWCSQPVTRYGEYIVGEKTYLIIPNAWENRKYHIKNYFSVLLGEKQTDERQIKEVEYLEKLSRCMNMAIELGE